MTAWQEFLSDADAGGVAAVVVDVDGVVVGLSAAASSLLGHGADDLVGEHVETLVPESARWAHARYRLGFVTEPSVREMGIGLDPHAVRKDGSMVRVRVTLNPLGDTNSASGEFWVAAELQEVT